jgi:hypothetical protein
MVFFNGNDELPRWAGYSLGYYLVKKYLTKTGKKIEDAFADKYADLKQWYYKASFNLTLIDCCRSTANKIWIFITDNYGFKHQSKLLGTCRTII